MPASGETTETQEMSGWSLEEQTKINKDYQMTYHHIISEASETVEPKNILCKINPQVVNHLQFFVLKKVPSPKNNQYSTLSRKVPLQGIRTHAVATNGEIP